MPKLFQNLPDISDIFSGILKKIDYQALVPFVIPAGAIILMAVFAVILLSHRLKTKKQLPDSFTDNKTADSISQGRRFRLKENLSSVYKSPTVKEELDFIISSDSDFQIHDAVIPVSTSAETNRLSPELLQYVKDARNFGMGDRMIVEELKRVGWDENSINSALNSA